MTGDCHVRFCERLRGETPLCLLGGSLRAPRETRTIYDKPNDRFCP